jgi:hypothetical protein
MWGLAAFSALQALPLPFGLVHRLSPTAAEVWARAGELTGRSYSWVSISLDPGASWLEALKWMTYGAAFAVAADYGSRRNMNRALLLPFAAAVVVAVVTLGHGLLGAKAVYGLYQPSFGPSPWHIGPLLNPNHLAGYLNLGLLCGLGLLVTRRPVLSRWFLGLGCVLIAPNCVVAGSRGGVAGLAVGVAVFLLLLPSAQRSDPKFGSLRKRALFASIGGVLVLAAFFTALLATDVTGRELFGTNLQKLSILGWTKPLIADFALTGVGRGAFDGIFAAYRSGVNNAIFTHPENIVVHWVAEWGVLVGIAALASLAWLLRPSRLGCRWSAGAAGTAGGLAALVAQNLVDFSLETPAVALLAAVALGGCYGHAAFSIGSRDVVLSQRTHALRLGAMIACGCILLVVALSRGRHPVALERLELGQAYDNMTPAAKPELLSLQRRVVEAIGRHPAEPFFYRLAAVLASRAEQNPMPWIQRALERGPEIGRTHLLLAYVLARRGATNQALLELRLATVYDPALASLTARRAVSLKQDYAALMRAVPHGTRGNKMLVEIAERLGEAAGNAHTRIETRERLLLEALKRDDRDIDALRMLTGDFVYYLERLDTLERCAGDRTTACTAQAERLLERLAVLDKKSARPVQLRARLLIAQGRGRDVGAVLKASCPSLEGRERSTCTKQWLELVGKYGTALELAEAGRAYLDEHCTGADACGASLERLGDLSSGRGDHLVALSFYERAARERPTDATWMKMAVVALKVGAPRKGALALERVRARAAVEPQWSDLHRRLSHANRTTVIDVQ